jgi:hypothetical protein
MGGGGSGDPPLFGAGGVVGKSECRIGVLSDDGS